MGEKGHPRFATVASLAICIEVHLHLEIEHQLALGYWVMQISSHSQIGSNVCSNWYLSCYYRVTIVLMSASVGCAEGGRGMLPRPPLCAGGGLSIRCGVCFVTMSTPNPYSLIYTKEPDGHPGYPSPQTPGAASRHAVCRRPVGHASGWFFDSSWTWLSHGVQTPWLLASHCVGS